MKTIIVCFLVSLLVSVTLRGQVSGQTNERVVWSAEESCHAGNAPQIKAGNPRCSSVETGGRVFYIIMYKGISYAVLSHPTDYFIRAAVQISNNSGSEILIDPMLSSVSRFKTEQDLVTGVGKASLSPAIRPDKVLVDVAQVNSAGEPDDFGAGQKVNTRYEPNVSQDGLKTQDPATAQTRVVEPGVRTMRSQTSVNAVRKPGFSDLIIENGLVAGMLADKGKRAGYLFFKKKAISTTTAFVMQVGNIDFVFPLK